MSNIKKFIKENFSIIVTGLVSLAAVFVSIAQVCVATIDKQKEISINNHNAEESRALENLKATRTWNLDIANFMALHRKEIYANNEESRQIKNIMLATFPPEITSKVFSNLYAISENKTEWAEAKRDAIKLKNPSTKIFYEKNFPIEIINQIGDTLAEGDIEYPYEDHKIPKGLTDGDVRYFSEKDRPFAEKIKSDFKQLACSNGYILNLKLIPLTETKLQVPIGYIEVWLSGSSIIKSKGQLKC